MNQRDPFEILASLRSDKTNRPLKAGDDPAADRLLNRITSSSAPVAPRHERIKRIRRAVIGLIAVSTVGTAAIAAALWLAEPDDPARLACYSNASADPDEQIEVVVDPAMTPEEQCARYWTDGPFGAGDSPVLSSCVTNDGITAVVPGSSGTCVDIGLASRAPTTGSTNPAAQVVTAISEHFAGRCVKSVEQARDQVRSILDSSGASDWEIRVMGAIDAERPCAAASPLPDEEVVLIVTVTD